MLSTLPTYQLPRTAVAVTRPILHGRFRRVLLPSAWAAAIEPAGREPKCVRARVWPWIAEGTHVWTWVAMGCVRTGRDTRFLPGDDRWAGTNGEILRPFLAMGFLPPPAPNHQKKKPFSDPRVVLADK